MFRRSFAFIIAAALGIALSGSIVMADDNVQLKEVVVTATKTEKQPQDVTQSVTVITADEIQKSGATNVAEVISTKAGVMVNEQGPVGALQSVTVRGSTYQQVLVLLDGKPANSCVFLAAQAVGHSIQTIESVGQHPHVIGAVVGVVVVPRAQQPSVRHRRCAAPGESL